MTSSLAPPHSCTCAVSLFRHQRARPLHAPPRIPLGRATASASGHRLERNNPAAGSGSGATAHAAASHASPATETGQLSMLRSVSAPGTVLQLLQQTIAIVAGMAMREAVLLTELLRSNLLSSTLPFALFGAYATKLLPAGAPVWLAQDRLLVFSILFAIQFDLCNQITGVEEDRVNKPTRPIASGAMSMSGAWQRLGLTWLLFLAHGAALDALAYALALLALCLFNCFGPMHAHWATKNLFNGMCTVLMIACGAHVTLAAAAKAAVGTGMAAGHGHAAGAGGLAAYPQAVAMCWAVGALVGVTITIQDLRDQAGDAAVGRRTLPLVLGDEACRKVCIASLLASPFAWAAAVTAFVPTAAPAAVGGCFALFLAGAVGLSARVWWLRAASQDDISFKLYTALCLLWIASPAVLA